MVLLGKTRVRWFALWLAIAIAVWRNWDFHTHCVHRLISGLLFGCRTDTRLDALLLGCLAALLLESESVRAAFVQHFKPWMWWTCTGGYAAVQVFYLLQGSRSYSLAESALLPVIIAGTVYGPRTFVTALLEFRGLKWIGRLSYSLYLWQQLFLVPAPGSRLLILQSPPLNLLLIFLCAWLKRIALSKGPLSVGTPFGASPH